ncbi:RNA polymerase subunit sigma-70 [Cystobacter ferrugineus]|uniref:RNA polymerase subunit sigma-70 n=2 Tax=Cystobacter ferrugineus TaxID=83449 RepID=A0A1L9BDD0_9BACT|nr:RNA polymerase subunit sigma-70 [Cystobacter ferrugineus]
MNALAYPSAVVADLARAIGMQMADEAVAPSWKAEVLAARRGDPSAFESLVRGMQRPVYGLALRLLGNEAEASEVAQEAFLRAYQHLHKYDESRPFDLWVMAIARNLCMDLLRRRGKVRTEELEPMKDMLPSGEASLEEGAIARQERQSLEAALATLSADDREVLALYYVQKRTTKEIAQVLGCAPGTIMARLFRAREKLRKKMSPAQEDPT